MENDEVRILRLLNMPRTRAEISEATGLEDERLSTVLQMLKRNDLAQLTAGKRWARTNLGTERLEETEEELEEEPEEDSEPPLKEGFTKSFGINRKRRGVLNRCEELRSKLNWNWEANLLKDAESLKNDISFIEQSLDAARNMEELEELEGLIRELNKTINKIRKKDDILHNRKRIAEKNRKLNRIRQYHFREYPTISKKHLRERFERYERNPELLEEFYQRIEHEEHLEHLLDKSVEYGLDPDFIRYISNMAKPKKLELNYILKIWNEFDELSYRHGTKVAKGFLDYHGPSFLKREGDLWNMFQRYMPPPRTNAPVY